MTAIQMGDDDSFGIQDITSQEGVQVLQWWGGL